MEGIDWTAIGVALLALVGTSVTAWRSWGRPKDPATRHIERADKVVDIQVGEIARLETALKASREREDEFESKIEELEGELRSVKHRVAKLEDEIVRLGGDPGLIG